MARAHAVAAIVEDAARQDGGGAPEPGPARHGIGSELGLHDLEQASVYDGFVLAIVGFAAIDHLADIEPVVEKIGEGADAEANASPHPASDAARLLGRDAPPVEILDHGADRA